ncbi:hypothetical protein FNU76_19480 [Chitinimonas arctica]|uniref:Type IV toxin-antitoxin system AbiEi family antitoxin domain-containing protein n=1 Tax=Chitinimonas arctica TaxID=2594795 RepID=A0A516SJN5_9NEIS|nr:hypothetical protein [Chitinimonas arctica]QDQ28357.1 hypothetical protein FNU76_19480 [Chitinimonas arctica]
MKLEDRMRRSIQRRSGNLVFRSDLAALGSPTQVTHALGALVHEGELLRLGIGIYAKAKREAYGGRVRPLASLETIIREAAQRLGLGPHGSVSSVAAGGTEEAMLVIETDMPRISRKLVIDGKIVQFRSARRKLRDEGRPQPLTIPTVGVARFVQDLAHRYQVVYAINSMDQWADTVTRLAGDEVRSDPTEDLLVALKRAGKLSKKDVATLAVNYWRERKHGVRSV